MSKVSVTRSRSLLHRCIVYATGTTAGYDIDLLRPNFTDGVIKLGRAAIIGGYCETDTEQPDYYRLIEIN